MKNWNRVGKIKAVILAFLFISNFIFVSPVVTEIGFVQLVIPLLFGSFAVPLIAKVNAAIFGTNSNNKEPNWNENPLKRNQPLAFYQFGAWFMITSGSGMVMGSGIIHRVFHPFGMSALLFGVGILIGVRLTIGARREE